MSRSKQSTNLASISSSNLMELPVPVPPEAVQHQLLAFLDRETTRIDALIEKKTRLIELLREKRRATVASLVKNGLPRPLKYVCAFMTSGPRGWSERLSEVGTSVFVQSGDLTDDMSIDFGTASRVTVPLDAEAERTALKAGDVVVCITGAKTGRVALVPPPSTPTYVNQHLCLIRPDRSKVLPAYLALILHSSAGREYFDFAQYGLKDGLSLEDIGNAPIPLPSLDVQGDAVAAANRASLAIGQLITATLKSIDLLCERRATLVTAAVTGQIDVRTGQRAAALEPA